MKLRYLVLMIGMIGLTSCQTETTVNDTPSTKEYNHKDAASYNTQLGLEYLKQGDRSRAKRKLLAALTQAPDSPMVNAAMAYFLEQTGDRDESQKYYKKALSLAPNSGAQLNNYGAFLCRIGQYKQAEEYFLRAVKDVRYDHTAGAYENAGLCSLAIPDNTKATHFFLKALENDPARKQSLYELVKLEVKQGRNNEALAYLQKYPELTLHDATLLTLAADLAQKTGKTQIEADYRATLRQLNDFSDKTGVKNEYNNNG